MEAAPSQRGDQLGAHATDSAPNRASRRAGDGSWRTSAVAFCVFPIDGEEDINYMNTLLKYRAVESKAFVDLCPDETNEIEWLPVV